MGLVLTNLAKFLYGILFVVLLPGFLVYFTARVEIPVSISANRPAGAAVAVLGLVVMLWGMLDIKVRGEGLPMNAFPPKKLVVDGIYGWVPHPIYTGFVMICLGSGLFFGSAVAIFVTTPLGALSATALVMGYERPYLLKRFGELARPKLRAGSLLGPITDPVWRAVLRRTERLANSWTAFRIGPVRIMNHSVFAGLAGGVGTFVALIAAGTGNRTIVAVLCVGGIVGAALFGQMLEGSSDRLSRPLGYFGGLLGIVFAGLAFGQPGSALLEVFAAFGLAAPLTQAIGRLRCVVQGCCHGAPVVGGDGGIVVENEHSRIVAAGFKGIPIYPTPVYSIIGNIAIFVALAAFRAVGVRLTMICGLYLVLAGLLRFVEEGYRGEPQTKIVGGLRIYQWFSMIMLLAGLFLLTVDSGSARPITLDGLPAALGISVSLFIACGFVAGVDFPESRRRFSRLSG